MPDVMAQLAASVRGAGGAARVQAFAHGPVADGMEVRLEPEPVQGGDVGAQFVRIDMRQTAALALAAAGVQVRLEQAGCEVLSHAILHDLDGVSAEPARLASLAPSADLVDLIRSSAPFPPQRALDTRGELTGLCCRQVHGQRVLRANVGPDDPVLPCGDPS